ncbi:MAG TPA: hypothetical protein VJ063_21430, partial [Verrucomicrobiae bacterium]|nr:hypothetical protein [Verrucomicrobiae bacterium]
FTIISNQLNNSKPLHCPDDEKRKRATQFAQLAAKNISYFLRVDAWQTNPELILTGDRNLCINGRPAYRLVQIDNPSIITWGPNIHKQQGNIGLVDGSAHQVTDLMLQKALKAHGISLNRFAIP